MKHVATCILVLALAALAAASCSISHRSGDFTCTSTPDCADGRVCSDGVCVVGGPGIDAGSNHPHPDGFIPPPDASPVCPDQCTSCDLGEMICRIDCSLPGAGCGGPLACPPGWNCNIGCTDPNNCRNGIDCNDAASCTITCSGQSTCRNIDCGGGRCKIQCSGPGACRAVTCADSCACDITCGPGSFCSDVTCAHAGTCETQFACVSSGEGCDTCP